MLVVIHASAFIITIITQKSREQNVWKASVNIRSEGHVTQVRATVSIDLPAAGLSTTQLKFRPFYDE